MSESIVFKLRPQAAALLQERDLPGEMQQAIRAAMDRVNMETVSHIQSMYLSFPRGSPATMAGLRVQSGRLRSSINFSRAVISGNQITASIGSNISYMPPHEFGFSGTVQVPAHRRRITVRLKTERVVQGKRRKYWRTGTRKVQAGVAVRAYKRDMDLPARRPIQRGILDRLQVLANAISVAVTSTAARRSRAP